MPKQRKPIQRQLPKIKILLKDNIRVHDRFAPAYLTFWQPNRPTCSTPHVPMDWFELYNEHEVVLKDNFIATVELSNFPNLHLTEYLSTPPKSGFDPHLKTHGPCLPMSYIKKIIDLNTGKQLWPEA